MSVITPQPFPPGFALQDGSLDNLVLANPAWSMDNAVTAIGTTLATAYQLLAAITRFSVVAASTGAYLPYSKVGAFYTVFNDGASALTVYAAGGATIDGTAGATGVALANAKRCAYFCMAPGVWISAQLGAVSA